VVFEGVEGKGEFMVYGVGCSLRGGGAQLRYGGG